MFSHISLGVTDIKKSVTFYDAVLATIGHDRLFGALEDDFMAYGTDNSFFIVCAPLDDTSPVQACNGTHICLDAKRLNNKQFAYKSNVLGLYP